MLSFFREKRYRIRFFQTIGLAVIGSFIALFKMLGRHGHLDETMMLVFFGIVILCIIVAVVVLEHSYKKSLPRKK